MAETETGLDGLVPAEAVYASMPGLAGPVRWLSVWHKGRVVDWARVDAEDYLRLSRVKWHRGPPGYVQRGSGSNKVYLHRDVLGLERGDGKTVDHVNRRRSDCRRSNLRLV